MKNAVNRTIFIVFSYLFFRTIISNLFNVFNLQKARCLFEKILFRLNWFNLMKDRLNYASRWHQVKTLTFSRFKRAEYFCLNSLMTNIAVSGKEKMSLGKLKFKFRVDQNYFWWCTSCPITLISTWIIAIFTKVLKIYFLA